MFLTGIERLSADRLGWMFDMLAVDDTNREVGAAVLAKELLSEVHAARDLPHARRRLIVFLQHCADAEVPELGRLARTSTAGRPRSSPTTAPAERRTDASRTCTCSPRRSAATPTGSSTITTTGADSSADLASNGLQSPPAESEAVNHAQSRSAGNPPEMV